MFECVVETKGWMVMLNGNFLAIVFSLAFSYKAAPPWDLYHILPSIYPVVIPPVKSYVANTFQGSCNLTSKTISAIYNRSFSLLSGIYLYPVVRTLLSYS